VRWDGEAARHHTANKGANGTKKITVIFLGLALAAMAAPSMMKEMNSSPWIRAKEKVTAAESADSSAVFKRAGGRKVIVKKMAAMAEADVEIVDSPA